MKTREEGVKNSCSVDFQSTFPSSLVSPGKKDLRDSWSSSECSLFSFEPVKTSPLLKWPWDRWQLPRSPPKLSISNQNRRDAEVRDDSIRRPVVPSFLHFSFSSAKKCVCVVGVRIAPRADKFRWFTGGALCGMPSNWPRGTFSATVG